MKHKQRLMLIGFILCLGFPGMPQAAQDAGTDSVLYLGTGARAIAMGRTGVTEQESAFTADWNPGSLGFIPSTAVALQHAALFGGALHESFGFVFPTLEWGTVSLTVSRLEVGDIERRDVNNLPGGTFGLIEQQAGVGYGVTILGPLSVGALVRVHDLRLDGRVATSPGADAGVACKLPIDTQILKEISSGISCRNAWSPELKLDTDSDQQFSTWRAGVSATLDVVPDFSDRLVLRADAEKPERAETRWHAGLEYQCYDMISVRAGWDHEYLSAGMGVQYAGVGLDYAVSFPVLGMRHLVTLSYAMGPSMDERRAQRDQEEERKRLEFVETMKNKIVEDYKLQAKTLTQQRKLSEAGKLWQKILDWEPANAEAKTQLGLIQKEMVRQENAADLADAVDNMQKKNYVDVMVSCQQILERDPENATAKSLFAQAEKSAQQLGNFSYTTNVKMLESIRQEYRLGLQAYTQRDFTEAVKHWEKVIETTPLQKQVYRYLQSAKNRISKEQPVTIQAPKTTPVQETQKQKLYKEAVDLSRGGKLKDAVRSWENLVKENPDDQDAKQNLDKTRQNLIDSQKKGIRW